MKKLLWKIWRVITFVPFFIMAVVFIVGVAIFHPEVIEENPEKEGM